MKRRKTPLLLMLAMLMLCACALGAAAPAEGWAGYHANGGITTAATPRTSDEASLLYQFTARQADDWMTGIAEPMVIGENVALVAGDTLFMIDSTGNAINTVKLQAAANYTCRPLYAENKIFIPLSGGRLQALDAQTLSSLFCTDELVGETAGQHQALTSVVYADGKVFYGTAEADYTTTYAGTFFCVDANSGEIIWKYDAPNTGYYWSGAAVCGDYVLMGDDAGTLNAFSIKDGSIAGTLSLGASIRSSVVYDAASARAYFTTVDGKLHAISLKEDGSLSLEQSLAFAQSSTGTPTLYGDLLVVGGALGEADQYAGVLAVVKAEDLSLVRTISAPADIKSAPLVCTLYEHPYAYFTSNTTPGGIYVVDLTDGTQAQELFVPEESYQNYCMASVVCDENGTLYYTNDSGQLFAIASSAQPPATGTSIWLYLGLALVAIAIVIAIVAGNKRKKA